jgi:Tfp pilus assembly protein PilO
MKFGIREIVFIALTAAIPVAAWWFVFRPANERNEELMGAIEARQAKLRELNQATGSIGDLEMEIDSLEKAIKFFRSRLPSAKEIDKVLQEVWKLAEANQLATKSIRTAEVKGDGLLPDPGGPYAEQPLEMDLVGPFSGFYGFLLALEAQPRIVRIQEMQLSKVKDAPEGVIRAECTLSVFFERGKEHVDAR